MFESRDEFDNKGNRRLTVEKVGEETVQKILKEK